jgi:hypothetical protein
MRAIDVLEHLKYGEMANTFSAKSLLNPEESKGQALSYINRALTELNKEFYINQAEYVVDLVENRARYFITSANVLKVIAAYKSDGAELTLNNENNPELSLYTPDLNTVEYFGENKATSTVEDYISVIYVKNFPPMREDLDVLPVGDAFLSSILAYAGYLAQYSVGASKENSTANMLRARYTESIMDLHRLGYNQDNSAAMDRLEKRGFV